MTSATKSHAGAARKINAQQAAAAAFQYFNALFGNLTHTNVRLEELEEPEDGDHWLVTIGFDSLGRGREGKVAEMFGVSRAREYKTFKVSARSGKVLSMKIRSIA